MALQLRLPTYSVMHAFRYAVKIVIRLVAALRRRKIHNHIESVGLVRPRRYSIMTVKSQMIQVMPRPDGDGYQVSYELGTSRKVHQFKRQLRGTEPAPHAAGSYHDPEQHQLLMARVEAYLLAQAQSDV
jgi:hypothetical protein